jgi:YVTN family beta-propeller protein
MKIISALVVLTIAAALLTSQPAQRELVGPQPSGGVLLSTGWTIRPAGRQVPVETFPMSSILSADGKHLLVLNGGYNPPTISVIDVASEKETSRVPVPDGWLGLTMSPKGDRVYVGGGSRAAVFEFSFANGTLTAGRAFTMVPEEKRVHQDFAGDVALSPDGRLLYVAELYRDSVAVINPLSGVVIERFKTGRRPYRILFHPDGKSFFVSSWADGSVGHYETANGNRLANLRVAPHPTDMLWIPGKMKPEEQGQPEYAMRLAIAAANTNSVYIAGVTDAKDLKILEVLNVAMTPNQPLGMTPSALSLGPDGRTLFVTCSDANAIAVAILAEGEPTRVAGFIPTGWYPTASRALADGRLIVLNGRGGRSYPNPKGPSPAVRTAVVHEGGGEVQYVGRIQRGTVSFIDAPTHEQMDAYTKTVVSNSPYRDILLENAGTGEGNAVPSRPGDASPIKHVIYIVKENRTYDQVFGDMKEGNGDPSLLLFGEDISPNHHKLAREFVLLDNFYVNSDVSADGHNWSTAAIAPDYVQKMWPNSYGGRRKHYDYEGGEPAAIPPAGYLWTNAASAGVSMRNYGFWCTNSPKPLPNGDQVAAVRDPVLGKFTNRKFRGFDLEYLDIDRAKVFLEDLAEFEKTGQMPSLILLRIGNDHTSGTAAGKIAPLAAMADNDYALGMIVEGVSKSRFWPSTAIFVLQDDAQNGPDHVDSHRSPAFVISPYVKRRTVNSTMYNTTSMLRTMELILGLRPMTTFDAGARPMSAVFDTKPDNTAYTAEKNRIPVDTRNPANAPSAARSAEMDFTAEDRIDDDELNEILWRAIRGTEPPVPVRSYFAY